MNYTLLSHTTELKEPQSRTHHRTKRISDRAGLRKILLIFPLQVDTASLWRSWKLIVRMCLERYYIGRTMSAFIISKAQTLYQLISDPKKWFWKWSHMPDACNTTYFLLIHSTALLFLFFTTYIALFFGNCSMDYVCMHNQAMSLGSQEALGKSSLTVFFIHDWRLWLVGKKWPGPIGYSTLVLLSKLSESGA